MYEFRVKWEYTRERPTAMERHSRRRKGDEKTGTLLIRLNRERKRERERGTLSCWISIPLLIRSLHSNRYTSVCIYICTYIHQYTFARGYYYPFYMHLPTETSHRGHLFYLESSASLCSTFETVINNVG